MFWIILTQSKARPELVFGDCESRNGASSQLRVFDRIEDARERKAFIQKQWPHLKGWVIELRDCVHLIKSGRTVTMCCAKTPFELPVDDRMTTDPELANCKGPL